MNRRNPAQEYKNKHLSKDEDNDMHKTMFFTPPTTTSKIESRTELSKSGEQFNQPFFTPDQSTVKNTRREHSTNNQPNIYYSRLSRSASEASVDSAKRLIYENRTIQHNYTRLQNEYCKEEEEYNRMKAAVAELRKKYECLTLGLKQPPSLREVQPRAEVQASLMMRINPKLIRKNTNALVKLTELKCMRVSQPKEHDNDALQKMQKRLESERRFCDELAAKNAALREQLSELRKKYVSNYSQTEYLGRVTKLEAENRDMHNIIKGLSEVLRTDKRARQKMDQP